MNPILGFGVVTVLVLALVLVRWMMRRQRIKRARRRAIRKALGPTTITEIEDKIPTIDDHGNRYVVIRTRTMETVLGPIGPTEVERSRRLTLPGHGHVIELSDTEFETFRDRTKLKLDTNAS
jgi:hypothetical protein